MSAQDKFIHYLQALRYEDSGTLAALRRACGERLAGSLNCQRFFSISSRPEDFLTVTLAAQYSASQIKDGRHHHRYSHKGSIGAAWVRYCRERNREQDPATFYPMRQAKLERGEVPTPPPSSHERFRTLLDAELELDGTGELAYRLRGLVRMLVAEELPIDVIQLAHDLRCWRAESRFVQERWARAFYAPPYAKQKAASGSDESEGDLDEGETSEEGDENAD